MESNVEEMEKLLRLSLRLGVNTFGMVDLYPIKRSSEANEISVSQKYEIFQRLSKIYEKERPKKLKIGLLVPPAMIPQPLKEVEYGCGYVCSFPSLLGINANGDVAPCDGLLSFKKFILGNVKETSLRRIWNHPLMKKLRRIKPSELRGICKKCKYLSFCMGGCRARAFLEYGDFKAPHHLCQSFYMAGFFPKECLQGNYK